MADMTEAIIKVENLGDNLFIVQITGKLDESNTDAKFKEIFTAVGAGQPGTKIVFDLTNVEYMNSRSLGYLTELYSQIADTGGKMAFANARANILDVFQVVGLTQLINNYDSVENAKKSVS